MISRDIGHGFRCVPRDAVTLNGFEIPTLNTMVEPYVGPWVVIAPNGRALDGCPNRPYVYSTIGEAIDDVKVLVKVGGWSTCR